VRLGALLDPERSADLEGCDTWFAFLRPSDRSRALLEEARLRAKKSARRASRDDGDAQEIAHRARLALELLGCVVASWDQPSKQAMLPNAFQAYYERAFGFLYVVPSLAVLCLEVHTPPSSPPPEEALARLRTFLREPLTPPPPPDLRDDPGLRALDRLLQVLDRKKGLTILTAGGVVHLEASEPAGSGDFI